MLVMFDWYEMRSQVLEKRSDVSNNNYVINIPRVLKPHYINLIEPQTFFVVAYDGLICRPSFQVWGSGIELRVSYGFKMSVHS